MRLEGRPSRAVFVTSGCWKLLFCKVMLLRDGRNARAVLTSNNKRALWKAKRILNVKMQSFLTVLLYKLWNAVDALLEDYGYIISDNMVSSSSLPFLFRWWSIIIRPDRGCEVFFSFITHETAGKKGTVSQSRQKVRFLCVNRLSVIRRTGSDGLSLLTFLVMSRLWYCHSYTLRVEYFYFTYRSSASKT